MSTVGWPALMRAGLGKLGLRPAEFWALTPAELMVMLGHGSRDGAPMGRARLSDLLRLYPDTTAKSERMDDE
ncbi:MAG: rcc01693 family protein [Pseudomonadota bacterium]